MMIENLKRAKESGKLFIVIWHKKRIKIRITDLIEDEIITKSVVVSTLCKVWHSNQYGQKK